MSNYRWVAFGIDNDDEPLSSLNSAYEWSLSQNQHGSTKIKHPCYVEEKLVRHYNRTFH